MSDQLDDEPEWLKFGVAASLSKQYTRDQRAFLDLLASMLTQVLPQETEVKYKGGLFSAHKSVHQIRVQLSEWSYTLEDPGRGNLRATRTRIVRGIALKTEEIPVEEWVTALDQEIGERARKSAAARNALAKFIGLS
ncbi:MAG TPA: hypothetical protein VKV29_06085 [Chthonomonas sp.]|uniref:hypothetical protein n=1 Tax=Chthonomonas sp. TaxID=2282153 RepID=UPI002B4AD0CA|nr:hypothetical protein [Chthonomonas sp.]HLH79837.1 hypothetical protein [Chthonomonas sp.]